MQLNEQGTDNLTAKNAKTAKNELFYLFEISAFFAVVDA
jgi:hypothetical protein